MVWKEVSMGNSRYKLIGVAAIVILLLSVCYFVVITISRQNKTAINVAIFPSDAQVTIDNQKINPGTIYLKQGTYDVKASRDGFKSYTTTLTVSPSTRTYTISLESNSQEGDEWVTSHQNDLQHIRELGEKASEESGKAFNDRNPIAMKLPYRTLLYTIGYQADPSDPSGNSIILTIDAPEGYRQSALYRIRQLGYDPTDFTIIFRNYENPFPL